MPVDSCKLALDEQKKQTLPAGNSMFPINGYDNYLDFLPANEIAWHWHGELEVAYIQKGSAIFGIQQDEFCLHEGEGIFINTNVLHRVKKQSGGCRIYSFVFSASLIAGSGDSVFEHRFVQPLLHASDLPYIIYTVDEIWHLQSSQCIQSAFEIFSEGAYGFELLVREQLSHMWYLIVRHCLQNKEQINVGQSLDLCRMKTMMAFIHHHYQECILLEQIAFSANISEREALRCFRKVIHDSPISYLLKYRISQAVNYLMDTNISITEISSLCGFDDPSYFAKMFKRNLHESPRSYRNRKRKMNFIPILINDEE